MRSFNKEAFKIVKVDANI